MHDGVESKECYTNNAKLLPSNYWRSFWVGYLLCGNNLQMLNAKWQMLHFDGPDEITITLAMPPVRRTLLQASLSCADYEVIISPNGRKFPAKKAAPPSTRPSPSGTRGGRSLNSLHRFGRARLAWLSRFLMILSRLKFLRFNCITNKYLSTSTPRVGPNILHGIDSKCILSLVRV